ncbi:MAG: SDR family NAD(P)-dependent oxidoreductase [Sciscionella sp.]
MRRVLVTGASGGIGRAIATAFAALGDRVAVHYRGDSAGARQTYEGLAGTAHLMLAADIAEPEGARGLVEATVGGLGGIDVLVNNAALGTDRDNAHPLQSTSFERWQQAWQRSVAVNLLGTANVSYCAARAMIEQGTGGRIVNIGSRGAFRGEPDHPAYGAAKAGLHSLGQSLALSLAAEGIAVATVAPGFIDTGRTAQRLAGPDGDALRAASPFNRVGTAEEVAAAVAYLASPAAVWAAGAVLDLNGASYLR